MNVVTDALRYAQMIYTVPPKMLHWMAMQVSYGLEEWHPLSLFDREHPDYRYAMIVLNQPINGNKEMVLRMWNEATITATVDGGTAQWDHFVKDVGEHQVKHPVPDIVCGDFDSVSNELISAYRSKGSRIVPTPDQNETDFHKCIRALAKELVERNVTINSAVALVDTSGRFDHIMANIDTLFKARSILHVPLYQLSNSSLTWALTTGRHKIKIDSRVFHKSCGIIPVGQPAYCTTTGLKWNMVGQRLEFGGVISTSNSFLDTEIVTIEVDRPVLFTMEVPSIH